MLKFTAQRVLLDRITTSLVANRDAFRDAARTEMAGLKGETDPSEAAKAFGTLNDDYFERVSADVIAATRAMSAECTARLDAALQNPGLADGGGNSPNADRLSAERLYALCFYAMTGKAASLRGKLAAKQLQSFALQDVMRQLSEEAKQ